MTRQLRSGGWSRGLLAAALMTVALGAWSAGAAGAATVPRPAIDLMIASPNLVKATGGSVVVRVKVEHADRCAFRGQRLAFGSLALRRTVDCHSGRATVRMPVAANRYAHAVTLHFAVTAIGAHARTDYSATTVVQAAKVPPVAPLAVATKSVPNSSIGFPYSVSLDATGGTGSYSWTIASGALPPGLALSNDGELAGTPTAAGQFSFSAEVTDANGRTATVALSIAVADAHVGAAPNAPTENSTNWSGYGLAGGPFTSVTGTFNIPAISKSVGDGTVGTWVGIDGFGPGASSIIQAGVAEDYSAATNSALVYAWYELYPAPPFALPMLVSIGDKITVSISQVAGTTWHVVIKDATTSDTIEDEFSYGGAATTAEWIVEAPFSTITQSVIPLAPFSPVTFTNLAATPTGQPPTRFVMFQEGQQVSTPSPLSDNGFTVGYGGVTPGAP